MGVESGTNVEAIAVAEELQKRREAVRTEVRHLVIEQLKNPENAALVEGIASQGHEDWRKGFIKKKGDIPRLKPLKRASQELSVPNADEIATDFNDEEWIKANPEEIVRNDKTGELEANINRKYSEIAPSAQVENAASAKVAIALARGAVEQGLDVNDPKVFEKLASDLHEAWLDRNESWADKAQKVPYDKLLEQYADPEEGKRVVEEDDKWLLRAIEAMGLKK